MRPTEESNAEPRPQMGEAKPFAYIPDPDCRLPETYEQLVDLYRAHRIIPSHPAIELGADLARRAIDAIARKEFDFALKHCCEGDLLLIAQAIRLCRDLHGGDPVQLGDLVGAFLQILGFGAGHVSRSAEDGKLTVEEFSQDWREACAAASET